MKTDKLMHFYIATLISFMVVNSLRNIVNVWIIFGGLVLAFLLFEVYQKVFKKGVFDWWDWFWGVVPALIITITASL